MTWFFDYVTDWIAGAVKDAIDQLLLWSVDLTAPVSFWQDGWAIQAHTVVFQFAWSLLTLRVLLEVHRLYIARDVSDTILSPGVLLRRTLIAAFWISATGPAVQWLYRFAYTASGAIAAVGVELDKFKFFLGMTEQLLAGLHIGRVVLYGGILGLFALGLLVLKFQAAVRGVELAIAYVFGPVFAVSAVANDDFLANGTLAVWWREVLVCTLNQVVQTLILLALASYTLATGLEIAHMLLALPILWVGIRSPALLRQYAYHSGVSQATVQGASAGANALLLRIATKLPF